MILLVNFARLLVPTLSFVRSERKLVFRRTFWSPFLSNMVTLSFSGKENPTLFKQNQTVKTLVRTLIVNISYNILLKSICLEITIDWIWSFLQQKIFKVNNILLSLKNDNYDVKHDSWFIISIINLVMINPLMMMQRMLIIHFFKYVILQISPPLLLSYS